MKRWNRYRSRTLLAIVILGLIVFNWTNTALGLAKSVENPLVAIKDLTRIDGIRENQISGYGLVIGLNGTGDSRFSPTFQMLANLINNTHGVITEDMVRAKNVAAVIITANLPPFARAGDFLDVRVASYGDAKSLQGGILLSSALKAPNGQIFAVAQGPLSIGGFEASGGGSGVQKNHALVGNMPNGAIIERTLEPDFSGKTELDFLLNTPNDETAVLTAQAINDHFKYVTSHLKIAEVVNAGRVKVRIPAIYQHNIWDMINQIHGLQVRVSIPAKVVINERTGTVIISHNVRISTVAVAHGNLTVVISTQINTSSETDPDGSTFTNTTTNTQVGVVEEKNQLLELKTGTTLEEVIKALNAIGASPRDLIAILQAMKRAGALHAELEIM